MADIVVWAGGYVGLTCAVHFAKKGCKVLIYDPDENIVAAINSGKPKAGEFLGYLGGFDATSSIRATSDVDDPEVQKAKIHIIAVPTERGGRPADDIVLNVLERIWVTCEKGTVVIVESTLIPGTIDKFLALPEEGEKLEVGKDVFLAVAPRRDWFADPDKNLGNLKRIVGGVTTDCTEQAFNILNIVSDDIEKTDYQTAEITKNLENARLHIELMYAQQLAVAMPTKNVAEAVRLSSTHWRLPNIYLNCGSAGRCVPMGSLQLVKAARKNFTIAREAITFEDTIRRETARAISKRLKPGDSITILGISYRPEFRDAGLSPGIAVGKLLMEEGYAVKFSDPLWTFEEIEKMAGVSASFEEALNSKACVLATPHKAFEQLLKEKWTDGVLLFDFQGAWRNKKPDNVRYIAIGEPNWTD